MSQYEFTSRYGDNDPSWLRMCFGGCEGVGWYPVQGHGRLTEADVSRPGSWVAMGDGLSDYETKAIMSHIADQYFNLDGWYFIECPKCKGTGRASWLRTIARIPRWLVKGVKFIWDTRNFQGEAGLWANLKTSFYCAFVLDVRRLWR